jgi:cytidylate kinase
MYVVTVSAAGGTIIGPALAERLGVPFLDRAVPAAVANGLGVSLEHAMARDEQTTGWLHRLLAAAAPISSEYLLGYDTPRRLPLSDAEFVQHTENVIRSTIARTGGVVLGRAGARVLHGHPGALHVRLDGARQRRARQAVSELGVTESQAWAALERNDKARTAYVRQFYRVDPTDSSLYHLVIDSTRVDRDTCVEMIAAAARSRAG